MQDDTPCDKVIRVVPPCPWCGPGTDFSIKGDGFGNQSLSCTKCTCKGPAVAIVDADFAEIDEMAIQQWEKRWGGGALRPDVLARLRESITLQLLMGDVPNSAPVSVPFADLRELLRVAGVHLPQ